MNKLAAHETEILLGNEAFIDRIVREDGSLAEKVVGKIYRNDAWEVNKKIYQVLKAGELRKKSEVATGKKNPRQHYPICKIIQNANFV